MITTAQLEQAFAILEQVFSEEAAGKLQLPKNAAEFRVVKINSQKAVLWFKMIYAI